MTDQYTTKVRDITVVDGVEVDLTIRDTGGGKRRVDQVKIELKEHLGRLGYAYETETPPMKIKQPPSKYFPILSVDWSVLFAEDTDD